MSQKYYSKSTGGFYDSVIHGESIPVDALAVSDEVYLKLLTDESDGKIIITDSNDLPITITPIVSIERLREYKIISIQLSLEDAINSGVVCNVLGEDYLYPTKFKDQHNIIGLITETLLPNSGDSYLFWCADSSGTWARRNHTKNAIQLVGKVISDHVKTQQQKYEQKLSEINVATLENIQGIVW